MSAGLLLAAILAGQLFVVARPWLGAYAPDPVIAVAAWAALWWPRRRLAFAALIVGWARGLVLLEPAGGQVLAALLSMAVVLGVRGHLLELPRLGYVLAALVMAGCWSLAVALLSLLSGEPLTGGRELVLGALLTPLLAALAVRLGARRERSA